MSFIMATQCGWLPKSVTKKYEISNSAVFAKCGNLSDEEFEVQQTAVSVRHLQCEFQHTVDSRTFQPEGEV
jgi:hypothetical protein